MLYFAIKQTALFWIFLSVIKIYVVRLFFKLKDQNVTDNEGLPDP
jgi:hypothetical protein